MMTTLSANFGANAKELNAAIDTAARAVPPVWPLASSVAVNPYLGQTHEPLATVAARLARVAGAPVTMPRSWYWERITDGRITDSDLQEALLAAPNQFSLKSVAEVRALAQNPVSPPVALPTIADLAAGVSGIAWPALFNERFGAWAASFFDEGQALWSAPRTGSAYSAWRTFATHDLTPEILGLSGFATHVSKAPETAIAATAMAVQRIGLSQAAAETYFHQLLMTMGGWAQYARYLLWQSELRGEDDATIADFLAIRLLWDMALLVRYESEIAARWQDIVTGHAMPVAPNDDQILDAILQDAFDRAQQRQLAATLALPSIATLAERPTLQVAFCIDVRSEVFRRALESVNPGIRTLGFAGFFGMTASHKRFASDVAEHRLPVLLNAGLNSVAGDANDAALDRDARLKARATRAWGRFKLAAVSSFAFVEATGAVYAGKLVSDALALGNARPADDPAPHFSPPLSDAAQTDMAVTVLNAMSLTDNFAPLIILAGHGANVVNNPHASGLQCGACGGYSGEVNARLLVSVLNNPAVRKGLSGRGIHVPADTLFVAGLHDTTMDMVTLYSGDLAPNGHAAKLSEARAWLETAGTISRAERALRLPRATGESSFSRRSRDWAEVRPEWALANCNAFIAAPRHRTAAKTLNGRAFLHDYAWQSDTDFGVLELIMTAPVVVASWISLQYYGSTVAPEVFGGGNKLLHNVVGGIGVVEGNGGVMRAGLPWQSVHDGARYIHEPSRLSVCIEAPREAMTDILTRHPGVRALFDNKWLHLFQLDEDGQMAWRYTGNLQWVPVKQNSIEVIREMATA